MSPTTTKAFIILVERQKEEKRREWKVVNDDSRFLLSPEENNASVRHAFRYCSCARCADVTWVRRVRMHWTRQLQWWGTSRCKQPQMRAIATCQHTDYCVAKTAKRHAGFTPRKRAAAQVAVTSPAESPRAGRILTHDHYQQYSGRFCF